jgi:YidC/Oxa1 family membrane protein insertase
MDNQRLLVWAAFGMLAFMTYQTWMQENAPTPVPQTTSDSQPGLTLPATDTALPSLPGEQGETPTLPDTAAPALEAPEAQARGQVVRVSTDVIDI